MYMRPLTNFVNMIGKHESPVKIRRIDTGMTRPINAGIKTRKNHLSMKA